MGNGNNSDLARVLLVEDHADTSRALARLLEMEGYVVTVAGRLEDAARVCASHSFDVLLVDLDLPDGNGLDLISRVRETCRAPAIVFSGYASDELREDAKERGFSEYLLK